MKLSSYPTSYRSVSVVSSLPSLHQDLYLSHPRASHSCWHVYLTNSYLGIYNSAYILERLIFGIFIVLMGERRGSLLMKSLLC